MPEKALLRSILFFVISLLTVQNIHAQQSINVTITDKTGQQNLVGPCTKERLQQEPYGAWFNKNYEDYSVDSFSSESLKQALRDKHFVIFMGTWCGDSRREVPRMYKILEHCGIRPEAIKLIMLSNQDSMYKQSPGHEERGLDIHRVPDLLVYDHDVELGRIVESPVMSLEKDLLNICLGQHYEANYKGVTYLAPFFRKLRTKHAAANIRDLADTLRSMLHGPAELNTYGYVLMAAAEMDNAGIVFSCNTLLFPQNANAYSSIAEYYYKRSDFGRAAENYHKTLQLDPSNENAKKMLQQLEHK